MKSEELGEACLTNDRHPSLDAGPFEGAVQTLDLWRELYGTPLASLGNRRKVGQAAVDFFL